MSMCNVHESWNIGALMLTITYFRMNNHISTVLGSLVEKSHLILYLLHTHCVFYAHLSTLLGIKYMENEYLI